MAQNLNIGTRVNGIDNQTNNGIIEKYCFGELETNCDIYGGLYQWNEMMQFGSSPGMQGICPSGWHLPTKPQWTELITYLGGSGVSGGKMKETGTLHWNGPNTGANNESGFTALPGGHRYSEAGNFWGLKGYGYFWSSTESYTSIASTVILYYSNPYVSQGDTNMLYGLSVRCVMD